MKKLVLAFTLSAALCEQPALSAEFDVNPVVRHYAGLVHANYDDTLNAAKSMQQAINAFLANCQVPDDYAVV